MKHLSKKVIAIFGVLFIALSFACCKENEKYTLELKFNKGDVLKQKMVSEIETSAAGQKMAMNMEIAYSFDVKEVKDNGFLVNLKYDAMKLTMPLMGISLDSNTEDDIITLQNFSPLFKLLTKQSFEIQMTKTGAIESFKGMEDLTEKIVAAFDPSVPDEMKNQLIEQFGNQYSQESFKAIFEQMGASYPSAPVKVGDTWTREFELTSNGMRFKINLTMTLKGVENEIALIDLDATVATVENAVMETNGMKIPVSLKGSQTGTSKVDMKTGWTIESSITQNVSGDMEIMGMKTTMSIVTKTNITQ